MSLAIRILAAVALTSQLFCASAQPPSESHVGDGNIGLNAIFPGENLLTPYMPPAPEWQAMNKNEDGLYRLIWARDNEFYAVSVMRDTGGSLADLREIIDKPGRSNCEKFGSSIRSKSVAPYPSITWLTDCKRGGRSSARMLNRAIRGVDSHYLIQKSWRGAVGEEELRLWEGRVMDISVCDTRKADPGCPHDLRRLK